MPCELNDNNIKLCIINLKLFFFTQSPFSLLAIVLMYTKYRKTTRHAKHSILDKLSYIYKIIWNIYINVVGIFVFLEWFPITKPIANASILESMTNPAAAKARIKKTGNVFYYFILQDAFFNFMFMKLDFLKVRLIAVIQ